MIITEDNRGNFSIPVIISLLFVGVILKYLLVQNNSSLVLADTLGLDHKGLAYGPLASNTAALKLHFSYTAKLGLINLSTTPRMLHSILIKVISRYSR